MGLFGWLFGSRDEDYLIINLGDDLHETRDDELDDELDDLGDDLNDELDDLEDDGEFYAISRAARAQPIEFMNMDSTYRDAYFATMPRLEPIFHKLRDRFWERLEALAAKDGVYMPDARHYQRLVNKLRAQLLAAPRKDGNLVRAEDLKLERLIREYEEAVDRTLWKKERDRETGKAPPDNPYDRGLYP